MKLYLIALALSFASCKYKIENYLLCIQNNEIV